MLQKKTPRPLYIFLDESGDFNFTRNGTKYFVLSGLSSFSPFDWYSDIIDLRYRLVESPYSYDIQRFHASEDLQIVRDEVFKVIQKHQSKFRVDSVIIQKCKTHPSLRDPIKFLPMALGHLLKFIVKGYNASEISELIFVTDTLPVKKDQKAVKKGIKLELVRSMPKSLRHTILHWDSRSAIGLQVCDYINWAINKKWTSDNVRSYDLVKECIKSEFDIFRFGRTEFY